MANKIEQRIAVLMSDGECDEGSVWEAILFAGHYRLNNLLASIDYNKIQSFGKVSEVSNLEPFQDKLKAFNWRVVEVDGHDLNALDKVFLEVRPPSDSPTCVIAHTIKGRGVPEVENTLASHYKCYRSIPLAISSRML